jgi:hypothetical protein
VFFVADMKLYSVRLHSVTCSVHSVVSLLSFRGTYFHDVELAKLTSNCEDRHGSEEPVFVARWGYQQRLKASDVWPRSSDMHLRGGGPALEPYRPIFTGLTLPVPGERIPDALSGNGQEPRPVRPSRASARRYGRWHVKVCCCGGNNC